jgi:hypothetical protein
MHSAAYQQYCVGRYHWYKGTAMRVRMCVRNYSRPHNLKHQNGYWYVVAEVGVALVVVECRGCRLELGVPGGSGERDSSAPFHPREPPSTRLLSHSLLAAECSESIAAGPLRPSLRDLGLHVRASGSSLSHRVYRLQARRGGRLARAHCRRCDPGSGIVECLEPGGRAM